MGLAVLGSIVVAQRFVERQENNKSAFPPIAELLIAALVVAGLSLVLRISIPLVPALFQGGDAGLQIVMTQFTQRWPGVIVPLHLHDLARPPLLLPRVFGVELATRFGSRCDCKRTACMTAGFILADSSTTPSLPSFTRIQTRRRSASLQTRV